MQIRSAVSTSQFHRRSFWIGTGLVPVPVGMAFMLAAGSRWGAFAGQLVYLVGMTCGALLTREQAIDSTIRANVKDPKAHMAAFFLRVHAERSRDACTRA